MSDFFGVAFKTIVLLKKSGVKMVKSFLKAKRRNRRSTALGDIYLRKEKYLSPPTE